MLLLQTTVAVGSAILLTS